jgi:hypothetical protein
MAILGILGAALCAISPAWGARGRHGAALGLALVGAVLALVAALSLI